MFGASNTAKLTILSTGETLAPFFTATTTNATSTFAGGLNVNSGSILHDFSSGVTTITNLEIGALSFDTDAGVVSWTDLPVTSAAALGTVESYSAQIDGNALLTLYATSNGQGSIQNPRIGIGTTTPTGRLSIQQTTNVATSSLWLAATDGDHRAIYMNTSGVLNFEDADDTATLNAAGAWTNAPSFSYLKQDREVLSRDKLLEIFASTTIETFKVISDVVQNGAGADTQLGIVLDEAHMLLSDRNTEGQIIGYSPIRTAAAAFSGVKLLTNIFDITNATTTSVSLSVGETGNIGIGTTTPNYKLHVIGDVAAQAFVNTSTRSSKSDIAYLKDEDYEGFLEKLDDINVATYRYNTDSAESPVSRLGLIAEEAPSEVLSASGDGVDIYKLASFTLGATKAQYEKIKDLELRLAALELRGVSGTGGSGVSISGVLQGLENLGTRILDGIVYMRNLATGNLTVGTSGRPTGITLYDEVTGEPYCLKIANGSPVSVQGTCPIASVTPSNNEEENPSEVGDTEAPIIILNGFSPATLNKGESYVDLGATVTDNVNPNLGVNVEGGQIDTTVPGTYTVSYSAIDQAGNTGTASRIVNVIDPNAQAPEESTEVVPEVVEESEEIPEVSAEDGVDSSEIDAL